ncbi:uncharacterized protein TNCV_2075141 [Trichonephila clavipes]|nr:uncharacterized protein TNCV_2075141 [Trichonephila clavipes]
MGLLFEAILGIWTKCSLLLLLPSFIVAHQNISQNMDSAPVGDESWCKFQRAKAPNIVYQDKSLGLPQNIVNMIKPVYMDLCDRNLLKKCLHGKTQNPNESFNAILWQILPKEVFIEHQTLRLGAYYCCCAV